MDENEIYEALGLTPQEAGPLDGGEAPQEGQEAPQDGEAGEASGDSATAPFHRAQAPGAPVTRSSDGGETPREGQEAPDGGGAESPADLESRWRALAQREVQRAVAEEQARNQSAWTDFFRRAGLKNSFTGDAITSKEEFDKWSEAYEAARLSQELQEGKLTPEALDRAVAANPTVKRAEALLRQQAEARQAQELADFQAQVDRELAEIRKLDPGIRELPDILKLETGGAFQEAVRRGHSFLDAFRLANFDRLQSQRQAEAAEAAQRAAQAARNNARSKDHLLPSGGKSGEGSVPVPGDVMELYRSLTPKATEAEITAHYNRALKDMKI